MDIKDTVIFKSKTLGDLMKNVFDNTKKKERQIDLLIADLKPLVKTIEDAVTILPLIGDYLEISVKNDEHLVKLATIAQRLATSSTKDDDFGTISPQEMDDIKKQIQDQYETLESENDILKSEKV